MCGIAGWVDLSRHLDDEVELIARMTDTLRRRGPDGRGVWVDRHAALGHRRLAVIDLDGGQQPMTERVGDETVALTYNGELYNYRELRAELTAHGQRFRSASDTEVLLRAYLQWGVDCLTRLDGIFAFAVWDGRTRELLLARDRMGVKPLYYHPYPGGLIFASEPKGLLAHPAFQPELDVESLPMLLNPRLTMPGETPLRGMHEVRPGHLLRLSPGGLRESAYWRLTSYEHEDSLDDTVATVRELLESAVARQLVADVPVSAMLSGGLDSTAVSALAARHLAGGETLRTHCVDFVGDDRNFRPTAMRPERDAPYAAAAARHIGTEHDEVLLDTADILAAFPVARAARDLPSFGQFDTSMHLLFARIREQSTVALSAEAADELFGGYPWYHDPAMVGRDSFPWLGDAPRLADSLSPEIRTRIDPAGQERDRYRTLLAQVPRLPGETGHDARMREVLYLNMLGPLACLLDRADRMSMAVGLEVRVPLCDHRLVEYVWNVPWRLKAAGGRPKALLSRAVADVVPTATVERRKSGYPGTHDPDHEREVLRAIDRLLDDPGSPLAPLLDADRVRALVGGHGDTMTWMNAAHLFTPIVEIDTWLRTYGVRVR
ncbi:asparagine synthase (glutamine-hydrolyzing) [Micromonospora sp. WMMD882]|uniref:asparagine synthase (glutamine-hydrolyzing) n=1 Tax=Micromonospora sp. WMMD882 TaxID=3015151 RepID=UPI00248BADC1|nr:asparagine synthase (glutamine-hydrolyzing) [Micromonospora sp. WMMD882]WBB78059.1 asparagine synthase (glutamine-hydrolyzing) [Micromonospora sp. WMMD882]